MRKPQGPSSVAFNEVDTLENSCVSICKTQMVNFCEKILTRIFLCWWRLRSYPDKSRLSASLYPLWGCDFYYKWHIDAWFPACVKLWGIWQAAHFSDGCFEQHCLVFVVKQHMLKASRHQCKAASIPVAIIVLLQDVKDSPRWCFPLWSPAIRGRSGIICTSVEWRRQKDSHIIVSLEHYCISMDIVLLED